MTVTAGFHRLKHGSRSRRSSVSNVQCRMFSVEGGRLWRKLPGDLPRDLPDFLRHNHSTNLLYRGRGCAPKL